MTSFWLDYIQPSTLFQATIQMTTAKYILLLTWSIYWIAFLLMKQQGGYTTKDAFDPRSKEPLKWVLILEFIVSTLFWSSVGDIDSLSVRTSVWYPFSVTIGFLLTLIGLAISIVSWRYLGKNTSFLTRTSPEQPFIRSGPYAYMRHPIYSGLLTIWFGLSFIFMSWAGIIMALFVFFPLLRYRAKLEEENLLATFGESYRAYMDTTWSFVPKPF